MKDIEVLIVSGRERKRPANLVCNREQMFPAGHTEREIREYGLSGDVKRVSVDDIKNKTDASLVVILDDDTYVPHDFINRVISFNNLFRDAGILCGPVYPTLDSDFSKSYHTYELKFGSSVVSDITKEQNSYPSMIGCVISGEAYNRYLYSPTASTRHKSVDNSFFLTAIAKEFKIYYSSKLFKARYLEKSDLEITVLSDYYYNLGYQDGLAASAKSQDEKRTELWARFVDSPEMFDNTMPRWLFDSDMKSNGEYAEMLVLSKCKYQIGFYEGMLGKEVI
jgi:hypothetical protein